MVDIVDSATRSRMMSGIKGRNTRLEVLIRSLLHRRGFRFRLNVADLPGKPDIVLPKYHAVIFVHGCFWHGHDCRLFKWPKTRPDFWRTKIFRNRQRDEQVLESLLAAGWRVATIWECAIRNRDADPAKLVDEFSAWLGTQNKTWEARG
ncbi:very short patch repair endonuclease [Caballeronia sp. J97]|uniref:very short patch repair endonuclease n=1 Tax=Caballeronia sp. J97 TaxID=2805429 RepID=UPI002AB0D0F8|nr:very short patch repair endonuclease [Caballeronia sp. J97]